MSAEEGEQTWKEYSSKDDDQKWKWNDQGWNHRNSSWKSQKDWSSDDHDDGWNKSSWSNKSWSNKGWNTKDWNDDYSKYNASRSSPPPTIRVQDKNKHSYIEGTQSSAGSSRDAEAREWVNCPVPQDDDVDLDPADLDCPELPDGNHRTKRKVDDITIRDITEMPIDEEEEDQRTKKRKRFIETTSYDDGALNLFGNHLAPGTLKWMNLSSDDVCRFFDHPPSQAMWLIMEPDAAGNTWFRPAVHLSEKLEAQYQAKVGYQTVEIVFPNSRTETFEHDLRGEEWSQRKIKQDDYNGRITEFSKKKIIRVVL